MITKLTVAGLFLVCAGAPVSACIEPPPLVHAREIAQIDDGIEKSKIGRHKLAAVKRLRARSEAFYKAGKLDKSQIQRHAALLKLGYKFDVGTPGKGVPPVRVVPRSATAEPPVAATGSNAFAVQMAPTGCGGAGTWEAPR